MSMERRCAATCAPHLYQFCSPECEKEAPPTLVDSEVAAYVLGVTPRRIRQLVVAGTLTNHGTPKRLALDLDAISRLAEEKQHG